MIAQIFAVLKFWKVGGVVLLGVMALLALYVALQRGEKLDVLQKNYETLQKTHQAYLAAFEKTYRDEKNRHDFNILQNKRLCAANNNKVEFDSSLRSAYDELRQRQADHLAR